MLGESEFIMNKDTEVEVCSEEDGFEGAWFRAVLEENTTKKGRKKIRVRYLTLLSEDSTLLVEMVEQRFIRPVPKEEDYGGVVIEEGVVVDAVHKDGWWTGVVIKEMEGEEFLVSFEVPPDVLKFEKKQLRAHVDWNGWKWNVPPKKVLDKSMFSLGTMVEVKTIIDKAEEVWVPAMVLSETEEDGKRKFLVKDCNNLLSCNGDESRPNRTVDAHLVRPTPPPFSVEEFTLLEIVEVFRGSKWRRGLVRAVLSDHCYMVSLEATKEESVFKHACVRPLNAWENGVWRDGPRGNPIETPSRSMKKKSLCSTSTAKPKTPTRATIHERRSLNSEGSGQTLKKCVTVADSCGNNSTQQNESGSKNSSTQQKDLEEEKSEDASRKRKRNEQDNADLNESVGTSNGSKAGNIISSKNVCNNDGVDDQPRTPWIRNLSTELSPDQSPAASHVEGSQAKDSLMALPFKKKSPYWKTCESRESFKTVPQQPHFSPLVEANDEIREWSAVGMMVTYDLLLDEVKALKLDDPPMKLNELRVSLAKLEKYGFNIALPEERISKLLSFQEERAKKAEEQKCLETKIEEEENEKRKLVEKRAELKRKILELQKEETTAEEMEAAAAIRIVDMKATASIVSQEFQDMEVLFEESISAPW